jgi:hypothetical protein
MGCQYQNLDFNKLFFLIIKKKGSHSGALAAAKLHSPAWLLSCMIYQPPGKVVLVQRKETNSLTGLFKELLILFAACRS